MYFKPLSAAVLLVVAGAVSAFPVPHKPDPDQLLTRTYDLKPVLGSQSRPADLSDADAVIRLILENIRVGEIKPGTDGPQIVERDGGKLEVRAPEKVQGEVKDLLAALARMADLAVGVKADLVELDPAAFEKDVKPLFTPGKGKTDPPAIAGFGASDTQPPGAKEPTPAETADRVIKSGTVIQSSAGRYANGVESVVSARQSAFTYYPQEVAGVKPTGTPSFGKEGYGLAALLVVSGDRRFVRMKLTEHAVAVVGVKRRTVGQAGGRPIVAVAPDVSEFGKAGTVEVIDGGAVLVRLDYAPKDKVWVVVLRPTIFIQSEEDERKKQEKK